MKAKFKTIFINILVLACFTIIIELIFGGWIFSKNNLNNLGIPRNVAFKYSVEDLYADSVGYANYSRDNFGFRGESIFNAPEKIDILTLGGSTTDQRFVDNKKTWQYVLEKQLQQYGKNYLIANAGIDGQTTEGHINTFKRWFPYIKNLHPKYVLFYIGINDAFGIANLAKNDAIILHDTTLNQKIKSNIKNKSALYNLYRKTKGAFKSVGLDINHKKINFSAYNYVSKGLLNDSIYNLYEKSEILLSFKSRLEKLVEYCHTINATPIFITQPCAFYKFVNSSVVGVDKKFMINEYQLNGYDYYQFLTKINNTIKDVAKNKILVIDLFLMQDMTLTDFYDWAHTTPSGSKKIGEAIFKQLNNYLP